eukprot:TRINITY_DN12551_c0_g1_i1.p1 TRINITY_DN12551_c0_g1~~TRINITY_DN12551_c0_g1_i1.p1  ORF type:complete len:424 (-),score=88.84 TRINITY_DN12551_c0_g1_i1:162-1364(-)
MLAIVSPTAFGDSALSPLQCSGSDISDEEEDEEKAVIISCENAHKTYLLGIEGIPALRGISLDVNKGEFLAIYGTSGGGKTSLLNILGTIDIPTKGNLQINGTRIVPRTTDATLARLRLRDIGFVFQTFNLLSTMTAVENVQMPMILAGNLSIAEQRKRATQLLTSVGMQHRADHFPNQLSGGEQQRVTIARAMANNPKILLLDEPTGDLDSTNTLIVMDKLLQLNREGITIVMVTHDANLKGFANRAVYVRDGKLFKEESIPESVRESRMAQLQEMLHLQATLCTTATLASEATSQANPDKACKAQARTEYRRPQDYKTYVNPSTVGKKETARAAQARVALFNKVFRPPAPVSLFSVNVGINEEQDVDGKQKLLTPQCTDQSTSSAAHPYQGLTEMEPI